MNGSQQAVTTSRPGAVARSPAGAGSNWTRRARGGIRFGASAETASLMKLFFLKIFTWWNGQTFGTQLWTWRFGELVGEDEQGNRYYRTKGGRVDPSLGFERRW